MEILTIQYLLAKCKLELEVYFIFSIYQAVFPSTDAKNLCAFSGAAIIVQCCAASRDEPFVPLIEVHDGLDILFPPLFYNRSFNAAPQMVWQHCKMRMEMFMDGRQIIFKLEIEEKQKQIRRETMTIMEC